MNIYHLVQITVSSGAGDCCFHPLLDFVLRFNAGNLTWKSFKKDTNICTIYINNQGMFYFKGLMFPSSIKIYGQITIKSLYIFRDLCCGAEVGVWVVLPDPTISPQTGALYTTARPAADLLSSSWFLQRLPGYDTAQGGGQREIKTLTLYM